MFFMFSSPPPAHRYMLLKINIVILEELAIHIFLFMRAFVSKVFNLNTGYVKFQKHFEYLYEINILVNFIYCSFHVKNN